MSVTKMQYTNGSLPILNLMSGINSKLLRDKIELDPDYQRGFIWSNEFKDKLFYSIVKGYPIGNISLRNTEKMEFHLKKLLTENKGFKVSLSSLTESMKLKVTCQRR